MSIPAQRPPAESGQPRRRILVVDDDADIVRFVQMSLIMDGYDVTVAHDGDAALAQIAQNPPDLVVLDLMMPRTDGLEVTRRLRADALTSALPIIVLTAKGQTTDKVIGLNEGADDYVVKPFDTLELIARINSTLRRKLESREVSPLTGLPGNTRIQTEIVHRLRGSDPFAVCYCDMDGFKAVNDVYGFARGDEFIVTLARQLQRAVRDSGDANVFLGHVGGDDFVLICRPEQVMPLTSAAVADFETAAEALYDRVDLERGYLKVRGRRGEDLHSDLVCVSVGVALSTRRPYRDPREMVADASEMKSVAKATPGSFVAIDRRRTA